MKLKRENFSELISVIKKLNDSLIKIEPKGCIYVELEADQFVNGNPLHMKTTATTNIGNTSIEALNLEGNIITVLGSYGIPIDITGHMRLIYNTELSNILSEEEIGILSRYDFLVNKPENILAVVGKKNITTLNG